MNTSLYLAFLVAATLLILSPGPTVMLVTSTSLSRGRRAGLVAVAGSTLAAGMQLLVVVGGLASVVTLASDLFEWIRWAGVVYLIWLGLAAWFGSSERPENATGPSRGGSDLHYFGRGFLVTLTNPKTLLFHGAFLPQFVDPALPQLPQMSVLAASFLIVAGIGDSAWAVLAARLGRVLGSGRGRRLADRVSGSILIGAAVVLAAVRRAD